jgi:hypothetical protein
MNPLPTTSKMEPPQPFANHAIGFGSRPFRWWLGYGLTAAAPLVVILIALAIVLFHIASETELTLLDNGNAPESSTRLIGIGFVILLNIAVASMVCLMLFHDRFRVFLLHNSGRLLDSLSLTALVALGTSFAVFDISYNVGDSTAAVLIALAPGVVAAAPLFIRPAGRLRGLLMAIAVYGVCIRRLDHGPATH